MKRLSRRSNPTGLRDIDKKRIGISITDVEGKRYFNLTRLDLRGLGIADDMLIVCMVRAGRTSKRFKLGTAGMWDRGSYSLDDLDQSHPLRFRLFIHSADNPRIVASAERIRPHSDDDQNIDSLIPMQPADLQQLLWKLEITNDGPVLMFNNRVFPHASGAESYPPFTSLVMPEALSQVLTAIARDSEGLTDEDEWMYDWGTWLDRLGAGRPPDGADPESLEIREWIERAVEAFCNRYRFAAMLEEMLAKGGEK